MSLNEVCIGLNDIVRAYSILQTKKSYLGSTNIFNRSLWKRKCIKELWCFGFDYGLLFPSRLAVLYEVKIQKSAPYVSYYPTKSLCLESHDFVGDAKPTKVTNTMYTTLIWSPTIHKVFGGNPMKALCDCMESCVGHNVSGSMLYKLLLPKVV